MKNYTIGDHSLKVVEILTNSLNDKSKLKQYKNLSGIYLWYNNITNEYYIGSSINLYNRLNQYYYPSRLNTNQIINRAILKYGHVNFSLIIIKVINDTNITTKDDILKNEQYYLDLLKPSYNMLNKAYNSMGFKFKHSEAAILKIKNYRNNSQNLSFQVFVYDLDNKLINIIVSVNEASKFFDVNWSTISNYIKSGKIFKNKYILRL